MIDKSPCGRCHSGVYAYQAVVNGLMEFGECLTRKEALKKAPKCKNDGTHVCFGARDFIAATRFPLSDDDRIAMLMADSSVESERKIEGSGHWIDDRHWREHMSRLISYFAPFFLGLIVGFMLFGFAVNGITEDHIKAGYFDFGGKAYRITEVGQ